MGRARTTGASTLSRLRVACVHDLEVGAGELLEVVQFVVVPAGVRPDGPSIPYVA
ncbi:MAG TPA: hypothetical protein VIK06_08050 [Candidatus Limnocylindrales bacterium]